MADEKETQTADNTEKVETTEEKEVQYVSMEEYKKLQQVVSKKDKNEREVRKQLAEFTTKANSEGKRVDEMIAAVVDALGSNELLDVSKAKAAVQQSQAKAPNNEYVAKAMGRLAEVLNGDEFETDPRYAQAKEMWYGGRVEDAIAAAKLVNTPSETTAGFSEDDRAELAREIRAGIMKDLGRVDTGSSTTTTTKETKSLDELTGTDTSRMNLTQLKEHSAKIWEASGIKTKR